MLNKYLYVLGSLCLAIMSSVAAAEAQPNVWTAMDPTYPVGMREFPQNNPDIPEIWIYSDKMSYSQGDEVTFYVHTNAKTYDLVIERDGGKTERVYAKKGLKGIAQKTPNDAYVKGCNWKASYKLKIPKKWKGGVYVITVTAELPKKGKATGEHFIVVKDAKPGNTSKIALMLATSSYIAYNDWGGANYYRSQGSDKWSPRLSTQRPWARGFARLPENHERHGQGPVLKPFENPRFRNIEWALANGYSRHYSDAGWAFYDRKFAVWAEQNGYVLEYLTQHDVHYHPDILDHYKLLIVGGHDEYWSWEMRDAVDAFVDKGGNLARFGGNYLFQVRFEDRGKTQVCYKVATEDPYHDTDNHRRVTTVWDNPVVNRPAAETIGLTGAAGVYSLHGGASPRASGGLTVYRPDHWVFKGTDLYYGDVFGARPISLVTFEVDGLDYTFKNGLPEPTYLDGAPKSTQILALAPAIKGEEDHSGGKRLVNSPIEQFQHVADSFEGYYEFFDDEITKFGRGEGPRSKFGSAAIVTMTRGKGTVFDAGVSCWANGLEAHDFFTEQITRNVLNKLSGKK